MATDTTYQTVGFDLSSLISQTTNVDTSSSQLSVNSLNSAGAPGYAATLYSGFSTVDFNSGTLKKGVFPSNNIANTVSAVSALMNIENPGNNTFKLTNMNLVERNLLNHINTPKGSRVMMPQFGSIIPQLLFEPLDDDVVVQCEAELTNIIAYDPRVELVNITSTQIPQTHTLNISMLLYYIELNVTKNMDFNLEFSA